MTQPSRSGGDPRPAPRAGSSPTARRRLLMLGAGHSHAQVLHDLAKKPLDGVDVLVVSPSPLAPYSGMVPGWLAGFYCFDEICIDFARLAQAAGASFKAGAARSLDPDRRSVVLESGEALSYDVLSIDIGSTLHPPFAHAGGAKVLPLRPLAALRRQWQYTLAALSQQAGSEPLRITAVGGGAAGVESLLAVLAGLREAVPGRPIEAEVASASAGLLPGLAASAASRMREVLRERGVAVRLGHRFDASALPSRDLVLWATGAEAHGWPRASGLAVNHEGFIRVDEHLRSLSHAQVFAAGDCIAWPERGLPKAGVFAVKMGPALSRNLRAVLGTGERLEPYEPQQRFLSLLSTADRRAIATWGRWSIAGAWVWRWKDHIDRKWVARFAMPPAVPPPRKKLPGRFDPSASRPPAQAQPRSTIPSTRSSS